MRFVLYNHVGSANHGCEALVRTVTLMLGEKNTILLSDALDEEAKYGITNLIKVVPALSEKKESWFDFIYSYAKLKLRKNYFYMDTLPYKPAIKKLNSNDILVSIGGDIFCYENYPKYNLLHQFALKRIKHSILIGCSIEPEILSDHSLLKDLESFEIITARETITYNALKSAGLENVMYCPDSAFCLPMSKTTLPTNFEPGNTVGINISPLVLNKTADASIIMDNLRAVVDDILNNSDQFVAFIPHVVWSSNDDQIPLRVLYEEFKGTNRVCLVSDRNAQELKSIISQCSYFIGARTHATIAAYSTGVPTLALGYSIKSKGIAKDLFGTAENYVISYKDIVSRHTILKKFRWIKMHSYEITKKLKAKTKEYQELISETGKLLQEKYD